MVEFERDASSPSVRETWRVVIFEAETPAGKLFDVALLAMILASVLAVMLESVQDIAARHGAALRAAEWTFTGLFTAEYVARLLVVGRPLRYARSFFGVVDLLAILPTYLSLVVGGSQSLLVIRGLRLLRVFRVFKMARFLGEAAVLATAIRASIRKILVFLGGVLTLVLMLGTLMYLIEGEASGFSSIPISVYWAIVTLTTVGYGDIAPQTPLGQVVASIVMLTGYGIIAVPTGIVTVELANVWPRGGLSHRLCSACDTAGHDADAAHCKACGARL